MKKILIPALSLLLLAAQGCQSNQSKSQDNAAACDTIACEKKCSESTSLYGTYSGTLPCADCGGKQMALSINEDRTYDLTYEYLDTDSGVIKECGVYNVLNDSIIETITPSSGEKTYYVYVHGNLILSDSMGTVNQGELADLYVLAKDQCAK